MTFASLDIPEIVLLISGHVDFEHILPCTLVNKAWYAIFAPLLFKEINSSNARSIALERYCAHATRLIISITSPVFNIIAPKCTHLTELQVRGPGSSRTSISKKWIAFLQNNSRINKVTALEFTPRSLSVLTGHCVNLQELVVRGFEFGYHREGAKSKSSGVLVSPLWRIAQRLTFLDLGFNSYTVLTNELLPCPYPEGLPMLRHLVVGASYSSLLDQARLISAAKNLETLSWDMEHSRVGETAINTFRELFASLQHLQELRLLLPEEQRFLRGEELTEFLMLLPPCVKEFRVQGYLSWTITDPMIQGPLSLQFHVLETLNLRGWSIGDNFIGAVFRSCPRLLYFHFYTLRLQNFPIKTTVTSGGVFNDEVRHRLGPLGWICTGLQTLIIQFVDCKDGVMLRHFLDQLYSLKELTMVTIGGLKPDEIQWREGEKKRTWRDETIERDEIASIPWMKEMWPRLESFRTYDKKNTVRSSFLF